MDSGYNISDAYVERSLREQIAHMAAQVASLQAENAALKAAPPAASEPVAWLFQHEETGRVQCVDHQQVEWGFEKNNPRLQKIAPLYRTPQPTPALIEAARQALKSLVFANEQIEDLSDGTRFDNIDDAITALRRELEKL